MPTHDEKPWWELEDRPPPWDAHFDEEAERLRQLRARDYADRLRRRERKRSPDSVPPPPRPPSERARPGGRS
ncbi:MAG TPA: hypothetical protein VGN78_14575 [Solirubrobacteraceae bacterium]|nr:hypothetical protein [Solirubrobacteraceae bacterium]